MGSSASLDRPELAVEPGQEVSTQLRVRNNGSVVDQFTFEPLGAGAAWIDTEPESLSLFPSAEGTVTIHFRPPRSPNVAPGATPFAIKVVSSEDPDGSAVEEGSITVGRFADRSVELYPLTARGRRKGRFEVAVDNRGNAPIDVEFSGSDPENTCRYEFARQAVTVEPGTAHFTKLEVIPHRTFWKGPPKTHQFQVLVSERAQPAELPAPAMAGGATTLDAGPAPTPLPAAVPVPEAVNGSLLQEALIPPWLIKAVLLALALLLLLWILWLTLFKPTVESAARDAVEEPLASLADRLDEIAPPDTSAAGGADTTIAAGEGGDGGGGTPATTEGDGGGGGATTTTTGDDGTTTTTATTTPTEYATAFGNPTDFQLGTDSSVAPGAVQNFDHPLSSTFAVTDVVLQNPKGDIGLVKIARNGTVLLSSALENFRDLDLHFVAPYMFQNGETLTMTVECTQPGPNADGCTVSASFGGFAK